MATTRKQMFLQKINGSNFSAPVPVTVEEEILDGMGGGGSGGSDSRFFIIELSDQQIIDPTEYNDDQNNMFIAKVKCNYTEQEIVDAFDNSKIIIMCQSFASDGTHHVMADLGCGIFETTDGKRGLGWEKHFIQLGDHTLDQMVTTTYTCSCIKDNTSKHVEGEDGYLYFFTWSEKSVYIG